MEQHLTTSLLVAVLSINLCSVHPSCINQGNMEGSNDVSVQSVSDAILQYTLKQYKDMVKNPETKTENVVTSPYSIWSALALTYLGARGKSSTVLENLLGLKGLNKNQVEKQIKLLNSKLLSSTTGNIFKVANKLAVQRTLNVKSCVVNDPFASVSRANFRNDPDGERVKLNNWVKSNTNGLIEDLLPPSSISSATLLAIINAVYFKGNWLNEFHERLTRKETFSSVGKTSKVDMMYRFDNMDYGSDKKIGASYVDLPYVGDRYSMLAILPHKENTDIDAVVRKMTPTNLQSIWNSLSNTKVRLSFPRFELTKSYSMKKVLENLGAGSLFKSIDLSGILESSLPMEITDVFHKSFIKVDEKGTEAAGATGVIVGVKSLSRDFSLNFNRPFAFILREKSTNAILFMGVVRSL